MRFIAIFYILLISTQLSANDYELYKVNYGVDQGLPSSECYEIIQDSRGYIWFGTDRGVVKYNGHQFTTYTTEDGLNDNVVFNIAEGPDGKLWFQDKTNQLSYLYRDSIYPFEFNHVLKKNIGDVSLPLNLYIDGKETIYFSFNSSTDNCVLSIAQTGEITFQEIEFANLFFYQINHHFFLSARGWNMMGLNQLINVKIMVGSDTIDGIILYDHKDEKNGVGIFRYVALNGFIYFSVGEKLYSINKAGETNLCKTFTKGIIEVEKDREGNIYVGTTDGGLWFIPHQNFKHAVNLISGCSVSGILVDRDDNLWVSTLEKGVYYIPSTASYVYQPTKNRNTNNIAGNANAIIYSLREGGLVNLQTKSKLQLPDLGERHIKNITFLKNNKSFITSITSRYSNLYIDVNEKPLQIVNAPGIDWLDTDSTLYGVYKHRLFQINKQKWIKGNVRTLKNRQSRFNCLAPFYNSETILLGTNYGIYQYKNDSIYQCNDFKLLDGVSISDIQLIDTTMLLISTRGKGLFVSEKGKKPYVISKKDGLVSNELDGIYIKDGYVFILSKRGLSVLIFSGKTFDIYNYNNMNGLLSNEVNGVFKRNDTVWVATNKGLSIFDLKAGFKQYKDAPIYLTSFNALDKALVFSEKITLEHYQNQIEFSYDALSYISQNNIHYKYQLTGVDKNWRYTKNRSVSYSFLPSGHYQFLISYQKPSGEWSKPVQLFELNKIKPYWEQIWFYLFCIVIILGSFYLILRFSVYKKNQKIEIQRTILDLERKALQAQMNPHFIFNALTSIQSLISQDKNNQAQAFLVLFSKLVRMALNNSSETYVPLQKEINLIRTYLEIESLRFVNAFKTEIELNNINIEDIEIPPMVIQPFIENAIEHGLLKTEIKGKGLLQINISIHSSELLKCCIIDNGVGRKKAESIKIRQGRKSKGIKLVKNRLSILNTKSGVEIEDLYEKSIASGTKVTVFIPYRIMD